MKKKKKKKKQMMKKKRGEKGSPFSSQERERECKNGGENESEAVM